VKATALSDTLPLDLIVSDTGENLVAFANAYATASPVGNAAKPPTISGIAVARSTTLRYQR
jgi:hypothetical protein